MSMVEVMVAAVILSAGVLGVFVMVETADKVNERNRERITATSLARELLEKARPTTFSTIGTSNWFNATLTALDGRTGNVVSPTTSSARTTVTRRGVAYAVSVDTCTVDEVRDGYGAHSVASTWCTDSTATAATDTQPEDLKRVAISLSWTGRDSKPGTLYQTATFSSTGQVIGPTVTDLSITAPSGVSQSSPVITTNPTSPAGIVRFLGTSAGAADMKFAVDGVEQSTGVSGSNGSWNFDWNIASLKDGLYTISATAIDALGVRGTPRVMQVRLARAAATAPANVTGGYNYVNVSGSSTTVVELMWDASPEGNVTGYEVTKSGTTVCSASLSTSCMDLSPASSGSTIYTVKTLYTDGAGNAQSVSSTYSVTAPGASGTLPTQYVMKFDGMTMPGSQSTAKCKAAPVTTTSTYQQHFDMVQSGTWNGSTVWSTGFQHFALCLPTMTSGGQISAGTMVWKSKWRNAGNNACTGIPIYLYLNGTTVIGGTGVNGGATMPSMARRTASTYYTVNFTVSARTFAAGDQLSIYTTGGATNANCSQTQMDFGNGYNGTTAAQVDLPLGGGGSSTLTRPAAPTGLTTTDNGDDTVTLTWTPPTGTPAPEFYRIYRDGQDYTHRVDTAGHTTDPTMSWTDTDRGGTTHTYRVTAVSSVMAESDFAGPVTR